MTRRGRVVATLVLFALALGAGLAGWSSEHVTGWTFLAMVVALAGLWVAAPLIDGEHPGDDDVEVRRITLDEACARTDAARTHVRVTVTREGRTVVLHEPRR